MRLTRLNEHPIFSVRRADVARNLDAHAAVIGHSACRHDDNDPLASAQSQSVQAYRELLERSEKEKKGLTFYVRGLTISGIVVKIIGNDAVEVRNQTFSRVIIKLDSIDALAIN